MFYVSVMCVFVLCVQREIFIRSLLIGYRQFAIRLNKEFNQN